MIPDTPGLHHVTAIAGDPSANAGFYVDTLGLRFLKRTVNHDDTGTYHFYFGDGEGTPGTTITFFPWTGGGRPGQFGSGQTRDTAYLIRPDSVEYWVDRLASRNVDVERTARFGETVLRFADPDGIGIELVASDDAADADVTPWPEGPVPADHQLRGFHSVTLGVSDVEATAGVLTDVLGYEHERTAAESDADASRHRYRSAAGGPGSIVDLIAVEGTGHMGVGTVHHVAFETADTDEQERIREAFRERGQRVTEIVDRKYFHSIYSREPGGVLFEVATAGPGFTVDEDVEALGTRLTLPSWLEDRRESIEAQLPAFELPEAMGGGTVDD